MTDNSPAAGVKFAPLACDEQDAELSDLFERRRERLLRLIRRRMDPRLRGRFDEADVLQETYLEAAARFAQYRVQPTMPPDRWLQFLAHQKVMEFARRHLVVAARSVQRETVEGNRLGSNGRPVPWADALLGTLTSPSRAFVREEARAMVRDALQSMTAADRQILSLRHFEQLSHAETTVALGLTPAAASKRYVRALRRLRALLAPAGGSCGGTFS